MSQEERDRAIYAAAAFCLVAVLLGTFALLRMHGRIVDAERRFEEAKASADNLYEVITEERRDNRRVYNTRLDRLEVATGLRDPEDVPAGRDGY